MISQYILLVLVFIDSSSEGSKIIKIFIFLKKLYFDLKITIMYINLN